MSSINLRDLQKYQNQREKRKLEFFKEVLRKCHHKITWQAKQYQTYCFYQIPSFIFGMPSYNNKECIEYIMNKLIQDKLKVLYIDPNILFITWDIKYSKPKPLVENKLITNNNKPNKTEYKPLSKNIPSTNFIYDHEVIDLLKNKNKI